MKRILFIAAFCITSIAGWLMVEAIYNVISDKHASSSQPPFNKYSLLTIQAEETIFIKKTLRNINIFSIFNVSGNSHNVKDIADEIPIIFKMLRNNETKTI